MLERKWAKKAAATYLIEKHVVKVARVKNFFVPEGGCKVRILDQRRCDKVTSERGPSLYIRPVVVTRILEGGRAYYCALPIACSSQDLKHPSDLWWGPAPAPLFARPCKSPT